MPFLDLVYQAAEVHRAHFNPREIQLSTLLSIKTGGCPEDCEYCPQSAHHNTGLEKSQMMEVDVILEKAKIAKARGASRFCMGAAWRGPKPQDVATVLRGELPAMQGQTLYTRLSDWPILGFSVFLLILGWIYRPRKVDVSFKSRR